MSPWERARDGLVLTAPEDRERTMSRAEALEWLRCAPESFDAARLPSVGDDRYDFHDVVNLGLAAGAGTSTAELAQRMLLRYTGSAPERWIAPREWDVRVAYACAHGCGGTWDVAAPAVPVETFEVTRLPGGVAMSLRVRVAGDRRPAVAPAVRAAYAHVLDELRSGRRAFRWLPARLRHDPGRARAHGVADCAVISLELAAELEGAGFEARTRTVTALAPAGIDHWWTEVRDADSSWKVLDPVFAHLASRWPQTDPGFAEFSCGSISNRVVPWTTAAPFDAARHHCAHPTSGTVSTIRAGVIRHAH